MVHLLCGSMVGFMATSSKRAYATCCVTQVCCMQSPCPCNRPLLTCATTGDTQTLKEAWHILYGVSGFWCTQGFVWTLQVSLVGMKFDSKCDFAPPIIFLGIFLCPWIWGIFFWWYPTFSWITKNHNHRKLIKLITWTTALSNSMKLWVMLCRATQDRQVIVESSDKTWSTGEGNGKPLQYSCLENPTSSMKKQKDMTLKDELPRLLGAQYATGEEWRNNSRKNEEWSQSENKAQ